MLRPPHVWIIGRTQTNGPADYAAVNAVQDGYTIEPAAGSTNPAPSADIDMKTPPIAQVNGMPALDYFRYGAELMAVNAPHATDWSLLQRMRRIGLEPGKFDADRLSPELRAAFEQAAKDGLQSMMAKLPTLARVTGGWQMNTDTMGVYGNYYMKRAIVALAGLGANQPDDAIYPLLIADADGAPLQGDRNYVLHFDKAQLPPADAFWSLTMYDAEGFQVANPINRFAIGDRDKLVYNADGSLDLYIQHASPGKERENNWLPAPANGILGLTMRLYAPRAEALDGRWNPPPVKHVP